jgi:hypothetical protein
VSSAGSLVAKAGTERGRVWLGRGHNKQGLAGPDKGAWTLFTGQPGQTACQKDPLGRRAGWPQEAGTVAGAAVQGRVGGSGVSWLLA